MTRQGQRSGAMVLEHRGGPLSWHERPQPVPGEGEVLVEVAACGVCRTDLHLLDGELPDIPYPIVPGHQVVGRIVACGAGVEAARIGQRVGLAWLGSTCGHCRFCEAGLENLCDAARFTGYQVDGGYATHCVADARFTVALPAGYADLEVAPLLCAGLIGFRCLRHCGEHAQRIGIYGFGAAAHVITQVARGQGREVYAFTRPGDAPAQEFARSLGAWAGASGAPPPVPLDAAIIFAPDGALVPLALSAVRKGGVVVCGGIHMSDIPSFPYAALWGERRIQSVANLTREDARAFLEIAPHVPVRTRVQVYSLRDANIALADLRAGRFTGAAVLRA